MPVFPDANVQSLADCRPNQLVRSLEYGDQGSIGVVFETSREGDRGILFVAGKKPTYEVVKQADMMTVLAYLGRLAWEVDQFGPIETRARHLFQTAGCIICDRDGWHINAEASHGFLPLGAMKQFNVVSGQLEHYRERLQRVAIFGAWSLFLEDEDRPLSTRIKVASFRVAQPASEAS